jgi:hypothetical protein
VSSIVFSFSFPLQLILRLFASPITRELGHFRELWLPDSMAMANPSSIRSQIDLWL